MYFELSYLVIVQPVFNKRPTCARHRARPGAQPRPPSPTALAPRERCEQRGDIRSHGAWPASRGGRGAPGAGSSAAAAGPGSLGGRVSARSPLRDPGHPKRPRGLTCAAHPTPGRVRPPPGLEDTRVPRPPALGRAGSGAAERGGGRISKGLPARSHLPAPGRGAGPRPRNWGRPVGLGSKPDHQAANSLVMGRAAAGATSRGTTLDGFPSRPPSPPAARVSCGERAELEFKCRTETGAWEERARPLVCRGWQPASGQGVGGGWSRRAFCSPSSAALLWTLAIFPS